LTVLCHGFMCLIMKRKVISDVNLIIKFKVYKKN